MFLQGALDELSFFCVYLEGIFAFAVAVHKDQFSFHINDCKWNFKEEVTTESRLLSCILCFLAPYWQSCSKEKGIAFPASPMSWNAELIVF